MCTRSPSGCCWISGWLGGVFCLYCIYCRTVKK